MTTLEVVLAAGANAGGLGVSPWIYFVGGLGTFIAAISGAVALTRKLGPEVSNIQITSANKLVEMAEISAKMSSEQADHLQRQNKILDDRLTEYVQKLGEATQRIQALEEKAGEVEQLQRELHMVRDELDSERRSKEQALLENRELRQRVASLEQDVARLNGNSA